MINVYQSPGLDVAIDILRKSIASKHLIVIFGKCTVDYQGRSESRLTSGERMIIIKQDGALLVHRPVGYSPVNWQPNTSVIEVKKTHDNKLVVMAVRSRPREIVWIYFDEIYLIIVGKLVDTGEFIMYLDEHEIRDLLYENPWVIEEGLKITGKEKKLGSGYADLFGIDKNGTPVVIEIKRITAGREAALQLYNYVEYYRKVTGVKPRGILVAPVVTASAVETLEKLGLEWREISIQKLWKMKKTKMRKHGTLTEFFEKK